MEMFLTEQISASTFCDEFYYSYDLEIDDNTLSSTEKEAFADLSKVSSRFSPFKEDINKYPGVYYNEEELRKKAIETKELIKYIKKNAVFR